MSNKNNKRNVGIVAVVIVIIAAIAGGYYYSTSSNAQSTSATSMMSSQSSMMSSETSMMSNATSMISAETSMMSSATSAAGYQPTVAVQLLGAGATFPQPLIQKWTVTYNQLYPAVTISYSGIGSGGGIQQITAKTIDFGASDAPLSNTQWANAPGLVFFPETLGGVAITYNLAAFGIPNNTTLKFTSAVIASIYEGVITKWNDPAIEALNPGVNFPPNLITAVHRSDGSGTTYAFTNFLSVTNINWANMVGFSTSVTWPVDKLANGVGAKGNPGVAGAVKNTNGAIGYVDVIYAVSNHLGVGSVENQAGNFIVPTLQTILWAAANATGTPNPADLRLHIVNAGGAQSYPICTYTYILVYKDMSANISSIDKAKALAHFFWWAIHGGQQYSTALIYVPLPANIVSADEQLLMTLNYQGTPLLP